MMMRFELNDYYNLFINSLKSTSNHLNIKDYISFHYGYTRSFHYLTLYHCFPNSALLTTSIFKGFPISGILNHQLILITLCLSLLIDDKIILVPVWNYTYFCKSLSIPFPLSMLQMFLLSTSDYFLYYIFWSLWSFGWSIIQLLLNYFIIS